MFCILRFTMNGDDTGYRNAFFFILKISYMYTMYLDSIHPHSLLLSWASLNTSPSQLTGCFTKSHCLHLVLPMGVHATMYISVGSSTRTWAAAHQSHQYPLCAGKDRERFGCTEVWLWSNSHMGLCLKTKAKKESGILLSANTL